MLSIEKILIGTRFEIASYLNKLCSDKKIEPLIECCVTDSEATAVTPNGKDALSSTGSMSLENQLKNIKNDSYGRILYWNKKDIGLVIYHVFITDTKSPSIEGDSFLDEIKYN